jgi:predicted GNAT family N-acyltransferase
MNNLILRKATINDIDDIIQLQIDIFHGEQKIPSEDISLFTERCPQCWCAILENSIVGAVAAWEENNQMHWGRFVIGQNCRRLHIGTRLAEFSLADLFSQEIEQIYMDARDITAKIICKMGGKIIGKPTPFYEGTVTPIVLYKNDFFKSKTETI